MLHIIPPSSSVVVQHYSINVSSDDLHLTASSEFSSFFLSYQRTRMSHSSNILISLLILLSGDIQSNPGPVSRDLFPQYVHS